MNFPVIGLVGGLFDQGSHFDSEMLFCDVPGEVTPPFVANWAGKCDFLALFVEYRYNPPASEEMELPPSGGFSFFNLQSAKTDTVMLPKASSRGSVLLGKSKKHV